MEPTRAPLLEHPVVARAARWGIVVWTLIGAAILGYIAWTYVLYPIRIIFPITIIATIVIYLLDPPVTWLEGRGVGRGWGTLIFYLVFFTAVGVALSFLVPIISEQVQSFAQALPQTAERVLTRLQGIAGRLGIELNAQDALSGIGGNGGDVASGFVGGVTAVAGSVLHWVLILVLGPVFAFYVLVDLPKLRTGLRAAIPARRHEEWQSVLDQIAAAIGGFFRGQLLVASFVALASMLVLWVIGLPYWAIVGLVAGVFNLVPMIGPFIGMAAALVIAFTASGSDAGLVFTIRPGFGLAVASVIALTIVQQVDNHVISPNVVARTVNLHPVTVMIGLLAFGTLFGFWGLLLAVPVIATIKILALHYWDTRVQWPPPEEGAPPDEIEVEAEFAADGDESAHTGRLAKLRARVSRGGTRSD